MLARWRRIGAAVGLGLAVLVGTAQGQESRVALVIGNGAYQNAPSLRNPVNDARGMATLLGKLGFDVVERENATRRTMTEAMRAFAEKLTPGGVGLFFYAGHGMQVKGGNFLLPVDAALAAEDDLKYETVDVADVLDRMDDARVRLSLVILDACRDNPFAHGTRSATRGLAPIDAPRGTVIAYATAPGKLSADGDGDNGLYTTELLKAMAEPGLTLEDVFKHTADGVERHSGNQQTPWISSSFRGEFYFSEAATRKVAIPPQPGTAALAAATPAAPTPTAAAANAEAMELAAWQGVATSRSPQALEAFLAAFPQGRFAAIARAKLDEVKAAQATQTAAAAAPTPRTVTPAPPAEARQAFRDCPKCPEMVLIPGGSFMMGVPQGEEERVELADKLRGRAAPLHRVTVKAFALGRTEVTFAAWDACIAGGGCSYRPDDQGWGRGRQPVINVAWSDLRQYLDWLSKRSGKQYRLPSEAEWEYAARAGTTTMRPWGDQIGARLAACSGCGAGQLQRPEPVAGFPPNRFGLQDVLGNVWEWVEDCGHTSYVGAPDDGSAWTAGPCPRRALRGGSWKIGPKLLRVGHRAVSKPDYRSEDVGFRVARSE